MDFGTSNLPSFRHCVVSLWKPLKCPKIDENLSNVDIFFKHAGFSVSLFYSKFSLARFCLFPHFILTFKQEKIRFPQKRVEFLQFESFFASLTTFFSHSCINYANFLLTAHKTTDKKWQSLRAHILQKRQISQWT